MKTTKPFIRKLYTKRKFKRLLGNSRVKKGLCSGFVSLKRSESIGAHSTGRKEEIIIITGGKGEASIGGKQFLLKKGMVLYVPPDTLHDLKNVSSGFLKYVYVTAMR